MADFNKVKSIVTCQGDKEYKGVLQVNIAGTTEPLKVSCASHSDAEDIAALIDGYCRLVHDVQESLWTRKGKMHSLLMTKRTCIWNRYLRFIYFNCFYACAVRAYSSVSVSSGVNIWIKVFRWVCCSRAFLDYLCFVIGYMYGIKYPQAGRDI